MNESKVLNTSGLLSLIGRSRSFLYTRLLNDPSFPRPFRLGLRDNNWLRADVEAWLQSRAAEVAE